MLENLNSALQRKNVTQDAVAKTLGISRKTLTNKLNGSTSFTIDEAFSVQHNFLPEYTMDYLFRETYHTES